MATLEVAEVWGREPGEGIWEPQESPVCWMAAVADPNWGRHPPPKTGRVSVLAPASVASQSVLP